MDADVVVIGGGMAGLAAATRLHERGADVLVVEAREQVGGRGAVARGPGDAVLELGAAFVGPTQDRVLAWADALGVARVPTYDDGEALLLLGSRRLGYRGIPRLRPHELLDFGWVQRRFEAAAARIPLDAPWEAAGAGALDQVTAEQWLRDNVRTQAVRDALRNVFLTVLTTEPADVSLLHLLWYWRSGGGWDRLTPVVGGAQQWRLAGGPEALCAAAAARLPRVVTGSPVRAIAQTASGVTVRADRGTWTARRAIVTAPPPLVAAIAFDPPLPLATAHALQRAPMSAGGKVFAVYDAPFWRADGLNGQALADDAAVLGTFDTSPPGDGGVGVLTGFVEGRHAHALWALGESERRERVLADLARYFGPRAADPIAVVAHEWTAEPWARGCLAHRPPGAWTRLGPALRAPVGRVHFASAETATVWAGYLDGAIRSGERAAEEALG